MQEKANKRKKEKEKKEKRRIKQRNELVFCFISSEFHFDYI